MKAQLGRLDAWISDLKAVDVCSLDAFSIPNFEGEWTQARPTLAASHSMANGAARSLERQLSGRADGDDVEDATLRLE